MRPNIESYLQQQLELNELRLGELSLRWAGFLWLKVDRLDFTSTNHGIAYHDGSASVRIPLSALFNGDIAPDKILLKDGVLDIELDDSETILPEQLTLVDVHVNWHIAATPAHPDWRGELPDVNLTLHAKSRMINAKSPVFKLSAQWDDDGLPGQLNLHCNNIDWLPESIRRLINGSPKADLTLRRKDHQRWEVKSSIVSQSPVSLRLTPIGDIYQFDRLSTKLQIQMRDNTKESDVFKLKQINVDELIWALGESKITAQGQWSDGTLQVNAASDLLPMPLIWSWLQPLGDPGWQQWLKQMQHGIARQAQADLSLRWPDPLQVWPNIETFKSMSYKIKTDIEDADIALGISNGFLSNTRATVEVDSDAISAKIIDTMLPKDLGHSSGSLSIPLDTLLLNITGSANTDVANLLHWFGPAEVNDWQWNKARANSQFELMWDLTKTSPKEARITLHPDGLWNINVLKFPLQLSKGVVKWDINKGISLKNMHLSGAHMQGMFSFDAAASSRTEVWKITSVQAHGRSKLAPLAAHFQLPLAHAGGSVNSSLRFQDGQWFGKLDMKDASWEHLLGSNKKKGEPFALQYLGLLDMKSKLPTIHINKLTSSGNHIKLHDGSGIINNAGLQMQLNGLHTPSFSGNLDVDVPFDDGMAWNIDVKASYLNRNALPNTLDHSEKLIDKNWVLRANIDRFDWDDARMSGVHLRLASDKESIGIMEAALVHTSQLDIMDVDARFTLPGEGKVELRKFSASFEKQILTISATLTPETEGGMRWKGFAELHGDFGHLMNKGGLSSRFLEGDGNLLFSGQGLILKEQPWWEGLDGRLRMRVDQGRILEGGTLTTLLSAINLSQLPALLFGQRKDLSGPGIMYERLQMEAIMQSQNIHIRNVAMRSSAFDLVGQGNMNVDNNTIDLFLIAKPLQNLDALLAKIPLVRDILGGRSHSLMRKVYHLSGPFTDAKVKAVRPRDAGLSDSGIIERLFNTPNNWFGPSEKEPPVKGSK
ncbi:AsmA-like C-terminal domain-containing protein [Mariprofundus sp. EBB-1]|uniref:AsmA-like C-terminal domain-containing protein n=1 Tax=Mariprofundus sp. EBB-1 TaxID=2650971 RepID=UPI001F2B67F0|nr:AsmA-like C-terminal domain-containing protein [Mariprofundus sp. EBB-1]